MKALSSIAFFLDTIDTIQHTCLAAQFIYIFNILKKALYSGLFDEIFPFDCARTVDGCDAN